MKIIKELVHEIKGELKDADKYYTKALICDDTEAKATYKTLALEEINHAMKLHDLVVAKISKVKQAGTNVPAFMLEMWNYEHSEMIECVNELKYKLENVK